MNKQPPHIYTAIAGIFLLLQGTSTLAFRVYPPLDRSFPALLAVTQMTPPHSSAVSVGEGEENMVVPDEIAGTGAKFRTSVARRLAISSIAAAEHAEANPC